MTAAHNPQFPDVTEGLSGFTDKRADVARIWAAMSHEMRTPLMGVVGMLEVLGRTSLTDEQRRIIGTAEDASVALMRIIDDVLDFAKLETGTVALSCAPADLGTILEGTADLLVNDSLAKGLRLTCEADIALPPVQCDAVRLRQVLVNLGNNAIKFTDSGHVMLSVILTERVGDLAHVRFQVSDSGPGIPQDVHTYLFQPFWQLAGARSSGGVGLGLAICRTLVDAMGGKITIDSAPGKGTRVAVDMAFPMAVDFFAASRQRVEGVTVISVGADPALQIAVRYLKGGGANIIAANNLSDLARYAAPNRVILIGPDAEIEDIEAATTALRRISTHTHIGIVWLHPRLTSSPLTRLGIYTLRGSPLRRADLYAAVVAAESGGTLAQTPARLRHVTQVPEKDTVDAARAEGRVILVAEDNRINQEVLRQQLAILGYDCDIAGSGNMALKLLRERSYPMLLCDCHMPDMDGFELTRVIRAAESPGVPRLPIIAITANAMPGESARCRAAGMDDYLAKPIEIGSLQSAIARWLGEAQHSASESAPPMASASSVPAPSAAPPSPRQIIDVHTIAPVYGNDPVRIAGVLTQWCAVTSESLRGLAAALAARAWEDAALHAHRIRGSAGLVGAHGLAANLVAFETALRDGDHERAARLGEEITQQGALAVDAAAAWSASAVADAPQPFQAAVVEKTS